MALKDQLARSMSAQHEFLYRFSGGWIGRRMGRMPVLLLTTVGRRTNRRRTTPLTYLKSDGELLIIASYGGDDRHPAWYLNLVANPEVEVTRGTHVQTMNARTLDQSEKAAVWDQIVATSPMYADYERRTDRDIPVVGLSPVNGEAIDRRRESA
ncbi:MAG: nitroreductase family deazaflavin-dependent oxidoreductase [Acidimicrobiia bacterium]|nr:nitroreductase family deazaflavin-dependent oxidoreductase [Acidimicrobiia bacterium]